MTTRVHCDGPDCTEVRRPDEARRLGALGWLQVQQGRATRDFHNQVCLAKWAANVPAKNAVQPTTPKETH